MNAASYLGALLLVVSACTSAERSAIQKSASDIEPVAECKQYEERLAACHHREIHFADQPSLQAKTEEDRERIRKICVENLDRISSACPGN